MLAAAGSRLVWLGLLPLPLGLLGSPQAWHAWLLVAAVALSALCAAIQNAAWLSWLGDLVPARLRGRYFGRRNAVMTGVGMGVALLAGLLLDAWQRRWPPPHAGGFALVFAAGLLCGMASVGVLARMPPLPLVPVAGAGILGTSALTAARCQFSPLSPFPPVLELQRPPRQPVFYRVYAHRARPELYHAHPPHFPDGAGHHAGHALLGTPDRPLQRQAGKPAGRHAGRRPARAVADHGHPAAGAWVLPVVHVLGGLGWSAFNLNLNTLLLALAPPRERALLPWRLCRAERPYGGSGASGGQLGRARLLSSGLPWVPAGVSPYLLLFAVSHVLRALSLLLFLRVREPREVPLERLLTVFGNLRTLNAMMGFEPLYHHAYLLGARLDRFMVASSLTLRQTLTQVDLASGRLCGASGSPRGAPGRGGRGGAAGATAVG
ncbi:MAG: hypothetical protein KatS3mg131_1556 [Candidatus Tectimicrobiota bacterium]|nr:MAG: hypothetical protein KatS3mg131_1556 [Candidatus Tectomicrobia bacterium]